MGADPHIERFLELVATVKQFVNELAKYLSQTVFSHAQRFETGKGMFAAALYKQRGKLAQKFIHSGMAGLAAVGVMIAPVIAQEFPTNSVNPWEIAAPTNVLSATEEVDTSTAISQKLRDRIEKYTVVEGDTVSSIASKFGVSTDTILWQNSLTKTSVIKAGTVLDILPVTGVLHKVAKGDTVYSIAKKYDTSAQSIVDFPYNTFVNDETFELAIGQTIVVPDGVKPTDVGTPAIRIRQTTPNAGSVVASGVFVWPASGMITQNFSWFHKGMDIANSSAPNVLAADSGTVTIAGSPDNSGYGNRVVINHGNGYVTLYAHMQKIYVVAGQTVRRGDPIGQMGSTGRSTGTHLHFEVTKSGTKLNPLDVLR